MKLAVGCLEILHPGHVMPVEQYEVDHEEKKSKNQSNCRNDRAFFSFTIRLSILTHPKTGDMGKSNSTSHIYVVYSMFPNSATEF